MRFASATSIAGALVVVAALGACTSGGPNPVADSYSAAAMAGPTGGPGLVNSTWQLTGAAVNSVDLSGHGITIEFTETVAAGSAAVNRYTTSFSSTPDGALSFGGMAVTEMAGDADSMAAERAYLAALATVTGYSVDGGELTLFADRQQMLIYSSR